MAENWDERFKIAEHEPIKVLSEYAIAKLGILMENDYQEAANLLGMDKHLPRIRNSPEKGSELLRLWSNTCGNQANFRIMKMLFSHGHRAVVDTLDDLMWCFEDLAIVWSYKEKTREDLYRVPSKVPIRIALNSYFAKHFPNLEVIFEISGYQDLQRYVCGNFLGKELTVIVRAVEEPEEITLIPGYWQLTRDQAAERLTNEETGTYLIRPSMAESDSKYALSSVKNGRVYHFKIFFRPEIATSSTQYFFFDDSYKAYRVKSLIEFYKNNNFSTNIVNVVPAFKLKAPVIL